MRSIKLKRVLIAALGTAVSLLAPLGAAQSRAPLTQQERVAGEGFRGSLVNMTWDCQVDSAQLDELSIEFFLTRDLRDGDTVYIAPLFGRINGQGFYSGIQTDVRGWKSKTDRTDIQIGRGLIFSRWAESGHRIPLYYAEGGSKAVYESDNYEGSFVSVRKPFRWSAGTWCLDIRRQSTTEKDQRYSWFKSYLIDTRSGTEIWIGSLRFDGTSFAVSRSFTSFIEVYGATHNGIPQLEIGFAPPKINGMECGNRDVHLLYQSNTPARYRRYVSVSRESKWIVASIDPRPLIVNTREERIPY
jgi:hypothetical protein